MKRFYASKSIRVAEAKSRPGIAGGRQRGVILVLTMWIAIVLALVSYSLGYEMQMEMRLTSMRRDALVAYELARVGVAHAAIDLKNDLILDFEPSESNPNGQPFDGPGDMWRLDEDRTDVKVGKNGLYSARISDEESKLTLHSLLPTEVDLMKNTLIVLGEGDRDAQEIAQAYFDYIDPDDSPIAGEGESETQVYADMTKSKLGRGAGSDMDAFRPKNDFLILPDELLLVPGMTPPLYYGYDPKDKKEVRHRQERLDAGKKAPDGLRDMVTAFSSGELNINTASKEVLTALYSAVAKSQTQGAKSAADIIQRRGGQGTKEPNNDRAFRGTEELISILGSENLLQASAYHRLGVNSHMFTIEAEGTLLDDRGDPKLTRRLTVMAGREWQTFPAQESLGFDSRRTRRQAPGDIERKLKFEVGGRIDENSIVKQPILRAFRWIEN